MPDYYVSTADFRADYSPAIKTNLDFSNAENPLGCSVLAQQAAALQCGQLSQYPCANAAGLGDVLSKAHSLPVLVTAGAGAAALLCVQAFLKAGQHIVMPQAGFPVPLFGATIAHGAGRMVAMGADLGIDLAAMARAVDADTALVFLCNPNNPTGQMIPPARIIEFARSVKCPVVVSEANADYVGASCLDAPELPENLIILRSFSKIHGLAGLRVGYAVAQGRMMHALKAAYCPFTVNVVAQAAAIAAFGDAGHVIKSRAFMAQERAFLQSALSDIGYGYVPSDANTMLVQIPDNFVGADAFASTLQTHAITVVSGAAFCAATARYIRISPRSTAKNQALINALKGV